MNLYLEHNYSGEAKAWMSPMETFEAESCVWGYHTYSGVWVATVGSNYSVHWNIEMKKIRLQWQSLNGSDIVGHIPRKISWDDRETSRNFALQRQTSTNDTWSLLLSTNTKIFAGKIFRKLVQTREKHAYLHPAKLTGYTVVAFWQMKRDAHNASSICQIRQNITAMWVKAAV